jgi:hypothetical protein
MRISVRVRCSTIVASATFLPRLSFHNHSRKGLFACEELPHSGDILDMRRAYCCFFTTFIFVIGCAQNHDKTVGFAGKRQDRIQSVSRDYDQREEVDDDALNFRNGNFDPDPDYRYF